MCMKKCMDYPDVTDLNAGQRVCLSRCAYKLASSINYADRLCDLFEVKTDPLQGNPKVPNQGNKLN
jgi:hypothetical protein